jgi:hypothetical protein
MSDFQAPGTGALMATSVSGQAAGAALAVIWLAYHPIGASPANGITSQSLEDALTVIFSMAVSMLFMVGHIVISLLTQKYLTPKT